MPKPRAQSPSTYLTHRRWTEEEARQALAAFDRSGLGIVAFAIREGLDPQRVARWRRRLAAATFEEVAPSVTSAVTGGGVAVQVERERFEIVLPSGCVVRVPESFEASALRRLLSGNPSTTGVGVALEAPPPPCLAGARRQPCGAGGHDLAVVVGWRA
jgi:transposase-like protein